MDRINVVVEAADALDVLGKFDLAEQLDQMLSRQAELDVGILVKAADTLDTLGSQPLADELDTIVKEAEDQPLKPGEKVYVRQLPDAGNYPGTVVSIQHDQQLGDYYIIRLPDMKVLARDASRKPL